MKRTCPLCGGTLVEAKVRIAIVGSPIGTFDGLRCSKCGEEYLAERSIQPAHDEIIRAGLFGVLKSLPVSNPVVTIPFTISRTGTGGPSVVSHSGLIVDVNGTSDQNLLEGHTPRVS